MSSGGEDYRQAVMRQEKEIKQKQLQQYQEKRAIRNTQSYAAGTAALGFTGALTAAMLGAARGGFGGVEL